MKRTLESTLALGGLLCLLAGAPAYAQISFSFGYPPPAYPSYVAPDPIYDAPAYMVAPEYPEYYAHRRYHHHRRDHWRGERHEERRHYH